MDGQNFVVFHNAADDSYMNSSNNFRGAFASTETVDIYFQAAASGTGQGASSYDKIIVACTNGEEDRAVEQLASAIGGGKAGGFTVIADDVNSVYACENITSVTSITMGVTGSFAAVESVTADDTLTASDSGKVFLFADAAAVLTLPDSGGGDIIGWTATFHSTVQGTGQEVKCADTGNEVMVGNLLSTHSDDDAATAVPWNALAADAFSSIEFTSVADGALGSWFTLTCVGTDLWHITGSLTQSGGSEATPFAAS